MAWSRPGPGVTWEASAGRAGGKQTAGGCGPPGRTDGWTGAQGPQLTAGAGSPGPGRGMWSTPKCPVCASTPAPQRLPLRDDPAEALETPTYVHELPLAAQVLVQGLQLLPESAELGRLLGARLLPRQLLLQVSLESAHLGEQHRAVLLSLLPGLRLLLRQRLHIPPKSYGTEKAPSSGRGPSETKPGSPRDAGTADSPPRGRRESSPRPRPVPRHLSLGHGLQEASRGCRAEAPHCPWPPAGSRRMAAKDAQPLGGGMCPREQPQSSPRPAENTAGKHAIRRQAPCRPDHTPRVTCLEEQGRATGQPKGDLKCPG